MSDLPYPGPEKKPSDPQVDDPGAHEELAEDIARSLDDAPHAERAERIARVWETPPPEASIADSMNARLAALDLLYERGQISASELGTARRRILEGGEDAPGRTDATVIVPAQGAASPPPGPPPGPPPVEPSFVEPPGRDPDRILGLPVAGFIALCVGGAVLLIGVIALAILQPWSGDDSSSPDARAQGQAAYVAQIEGPLGRLTDSAVATGTSLARVSRPADLERLARNADRQIDVVERARRTLSDMSVDPQDRSAQQALLAASATQRRYLVTLQRAAELPPTQGLALVGRVRTQAAALDNRYAKFFALVPQAPDAITGTDLDDTAGLRTALREKRAREQAAATPGPATRTPSAPAPTPSVYSGSGFSSPTGNLRCFNYGTTLRCSSANDGFSVSLDEYGSPYSTSGSVEGGGQVVPYGSDWASGVFRCDSEFDGITCRSVSSGRGFFLNRDTYTAL